MTEAVEFRNVFQHANGRLVLNDVSFTIGRGEVFALIGQNGAGKTLLLRLIMVLDRPTAGDIRVLGQNTETLAGATLMRFRRSLGLVLQGGSLLHGLSVLENLLLPIRNQGYENDTMRRKVRLIMTQLRLDGLENLYPRELSGGVLRKVELARALIQKPEILIWDELLDGLDPGSVGEIEEHLAREIRNRELTILFTTHQASAIRSFVDRVGVLDHGCLLFEGAIAKLYERAERDLALKYALKGWL